MFAVCTMADHTSRAGNHQQGNVFAETFGYRYRAGKELLLVVAENLLRGKIVGGGAELADPRRHHDNVLFFGVDPFQRPFQVVQRVVVADRHQHVAGTDAQSGALHCVALQQLEVFLHVLLGQRMFAAVHALGDGEDQEERRRQKKRPRRWRLTW